MSTVSKAIQQMIDFYQGNEHDIAHFLKVYVLAKTIGEQEELPVQTQQTLELAAIVHDIACPLCRNKYGNTNGENQEKESKPLVDQFLKNIDVPQDMKERVSWLVQHHHTYTGVDGLDYRILLEADFLVNAQEQHFSEQAVRSALDRVFQTDTGKHLLTSMCQCAPDCDAAKRSV